MVQNSIASQSSSLRSGMATGGRLLKRKCASSTGPSTARAPRPSSRWRGIHGTSSSSPRSASSNRASSSSRRFPTMERRRARSSSRSRRMSWPRRTCSKNSRRRRWRLWSECLPIDLLPDARQRRHIYIDAPLNSVIMTSVS